jgi:hypothetical protein
MATVKGKVRRSQIVTTYGVGAIVALADESFMVAGIDTWPVEGSNLHEPRLERELMVRGFVVPPASEDDSPDIPVVRFPRWHYCQKCGVLADHRDLTDFPDSNTCNECNRPLVPSRFVAVCPRGHINDFPYLRWVHRGTPDKSKEHQLQLRTRGASASLRDIEISCSCDKEMRRSMDGAFDRFALREITQCFGDRPWLGRASEPCDETMRTLQRGASNVWFGSHRSVISIPPWSDNAFQLLDAHWDLYRALSGSALETAIEAMNLTEGTEFTTADLVEAVQERKRRQQEGGGGPTDERSIRRDEYRALSLGQRDEPGNQFAGHSVPLTTTSSKFFERAVVVTRLREVRALEGFTRILPPGSGSDQLAALYAVDPGWRPAIEVRGEGLFLVFDEDSLGEWEARDVVKKRIGRIDDRYRARAERWGNPPDRSITPRLVLMHSLAHALIDQFALDAGYPSASLRERLYVDEEDMRGVLIYTATTDSAGSLGGLIAQGEPERLEYALRAAMARASWCSADPICSESEGQGVDALNLAACHSCTLLPETSCEEMNLLLDRAALVGLPGASELGFFGTLLAAG